MKFFCVYILNIISCIFYQSYQLIKSKDQFLFWKLIFNHWVTTQGIIFLCVNSKNSSLYFVSIRPAQKWNYFVVWMWLEFIQYNDILEFFWVWISNIISCIFYQSHQFKNFKSQFSKISYCIITNRQKNSAFKQIF